MEIVVMVDMSNIVDMVGMVYIKDIVYMVYKVGMEDRGENMELVDTMTMLDDMDRIYWIWTRVSHCRNVADGRQGDLGDRFEIKDMVEMMYMLDQVDLSDMVDMVDTLDNVDMWGMCL